MDHRERDGPQRSDGQLFTIRLPTDTERSFRDIKEAWSWHRDQGDGMTRRRQMYDECNYPYPFLVYSILCLLPSQSNQSKLLWSWLKSIQLRVETLLVWCQRKRGTVLFKVEKDIPSPPITHFLRKWRGFKEKRKSKNACNGGCAGAGVLDLSATKWLAKPSLCFPGQSASSMSPLTCSGLIHG